MFPTSFSSLERLRLRPDEANWQRLVAPPGMTGFAQLRITREMTWAEKLAHDLEYIADRSVDLYLMVCLATAWRIATTPFRALARRL